MLHCNLLKETLPPKRKTYSIPLISWQIYGTRYYKDIRWFYQIVNVIHAYYGQGPLLLTWFNFNHSMDK